MCGKHCKNCLITLLRKISAVSANDPCILALISETGWAEVSRLLNMYRIRYSDKKENKITLIYEEIQNGAVAKSCMRKCPNI
jgi:hypothetical protein